MIKKHDEGKEKKKKTKVPPRFELGSLDSESRVLTITPWDHHTQVEEKLTYINNKTDRWSFSGFRSIITQG